MSGRRGRGTVRGRGRGRGRGKAQANNESVENEPVEVSPESALPVSEATDTSNLANDKAAQSELDTININKISDPAECCVGNLESTDAALETTQELKEPEVNTKKESDIINIEADACPRNLANDKAATSELDTININKISDTAECCVGNLESTDAALEATQELKEQEVNTNKESDIINIEADAISLAPNITDSSLEPSSNEPEIIELNSDDDDDDDDAQATVIQEKELTSSNVETKESCGLDASADEKDVYDENDVINLDDDDDNDDDANRDDGDHKITKDEDFYCAVCDIDCKSKQVFEDHVKGYYHCQKMRTTNEEKAVRDEDERQAVDAAAAAEAEGNQAEEEEDLEIEMDGNDEMEMDGNDESVDIAISSKSWILLDEMDDEMDETGASGTEEDKTTAGNHEKLSAAEEKEEPETVMCDATGIKNEDPSSDSAGWNSTKEEEADHAKSKEAKAIESSKQDDVGKSEVASEEAAGDSEAEGDAVLDPWYCAACDVRCDSDKAYHMHTRGMMHTLNCGSSSSAAERPKPVPQVYRVPETLKEKAKKSDTKKPKEKRSSGRGMYNDVILIDDDESEEEEDVEGSNKEYDWLGGVADDNYYCEICDCSTTSEQNYEAHLNGARHKKNMKNRDLGVPVKKPKGKVAMGGMQAKVVNCEPKAQEMINNCKDALIGLHYMTEFCHSSPEVEPRYVCNLCEAKCDVRMVILHMTGLKHRLNYMKKHHTNYAILVQQRTRKSDQTPIAEQLSKEIEALNGRQKMVVKMDMGGKAAPGHLTKGATTKGMKEKQEPTSRIDVGGKAPSGLLAKGMKEKQEPTSRIEPRKRRASSEDARPRSGRSSPIDIRSVSPEDRRKRPEKRALSRERRSSRSDSRRRDRSPVRLSERRRTRSRSRDRHTSTRRDSDRDRMKDIKSSERDRHDRGDRRDPSPGREQRYDNNRRDQDFRTTKDLGLYSRTQDLLNRAKALYGSGTNALYGSGTNAPYGSGTNAPYGSGTNAPYGSGTNVLYGSGMNAPYGSGTNYSYAQAASVPYGLVSRTAFATSTTYPAGYGSAYPSVPRMTVGATLPPPKRSRFSDASPVPPVSYVSSANLLNMYGTLGTMAPYANHANLYAARLLNPPAPQPVPPVTQSPLLSYGSTGYQRSLGLTSLQSSSAAYGTKSGSGSLSSRAADSGDSFSALSSIVAGVSARTRDDDEAAAMSKVIAEAVIKYKMQKAQEKLQQPSSTLERLQRRY